MSIIISATRDYDELDRCVESVLEKSTYDNFEVLLLEGAVAAGRLAQWPSRDNRVRVITHTAGSNMARSNNLAAASANGEYLLFLHADSEVITADWIDAMTEQAQRPSIGAVGAYLLYPDDAVQHAGLILGLGGVAGHGHKHFHCEQPGYFFGLKAINNFSAVSGACLMTRRAVFQEVGGFDESLEAAYSDVDLCLKMKMAGYHNVWLPHVRMYHFESAGHEYEDLPDYDALLERDTAAMQQRWRTADLPDPCYNPNLTLAREDYSYRKPTPITASR